MLKGVLNRHSQIGVAANVKQMLRITILQFTTATYPNNAKGAYC